MLVSECSIPFFGFFFGPPEFVHFTILICILSLKVAVNQLYKLLQSYNCICLLLNSNLEEG